MQKAVRMQVSAQRLNPGSPHRSVQKLVRDHYQSYSFLKMAVQMQELDLLWAAREAV